MSTATAAREPIITLRVPPFASTFPNFSSVLLPPDGFSTLEVWLEGALGTINPSTVRVTLNEAPMALFTSVNPLPAGLRVIVRLGLSVNPDYTIHRDGESVLTFVATDAGGVTYRARFYLSVDATKSQPEASRTTRARLQESTVVAPAQHQPPTIVLNGEWPARTGDRSLVLDAEVTDGEGLRRIVIEVNAKDVEEVLLQNERPVRYQGGRIVRAATPGSVEGNGTKVHLSIPVRLQSNRINIVAVRAENLVGLAARSDRTVENVAK